MQVTNLNDLSDKDDLDADLVIVGGGPAGLTIAAQLGDLSIGIVLLESGLVEDSPAHEALNTLEHCGSAQSRDWAALRAAFHKPSIPGFDPLAQPFGVRRRGIGGAARYWGAKIAYFEPSDFRHREWVPNSGWPISEAEMLPFVRRAECMLNLAPYNAGGGGEPSSPRVASSRGCATVPVDWRYARAPGSDRETYDFRAQWDGRQQANLRVVTNATVTRLRTNEQGTRFEGLSVRSVEGRCFELRARECVLAAGAIENPRLLLVSDEVHSAGLGNAYDQVGRCLMDHPGAEIGRIPWSPELADAPIRFHTTREKGRVAVRSLGLRLSDQIKRSERLLNAAVYGVVEIAVDDPIDALRHLIRGTSNDPARDLASVVRGTPGIAKAAVAVALSDRRVPGPMRTAATGVLARCLPRFFARLLWPYGAPRKSAALVLHAITEQAPDPDNRVVLGEAEDPTGVRRARVEWRYGALEVRSIRRLAEAMTNRLQEMGLPRPQLAGWIAKDGVEEAPLIDMAHMLGTTRMAADPRFGVVDRDCQVFRVEGLSIAGGSVFPTSGHANPTLLILALAIRLADHLRIRLDPDQG